MAALTARTPLILDATNDLKRVDAVMTKVVNDRSRWDDFFSDPNGALVAHGLHPPTTSEVNSRVNDLFYAVLANKPLLELLAKALKSRRRNKAREAKYFRLYEAGLKQGQIRHDIAQDVDALSWIVSDKRRFTNALRLTLHDVNDRGLLQRKHPRKDIDAYVKHVVELASAGKSLRTLPALETWDRNYGIGKAFGGLWVEVTPFVTGVAFVEVLVAVTVGVDHDLQPAAPSLAAMTAGARRGDRREVEALAMYGKLLAFSGELMMHVANFESTR
jgi:hypothetical protein